MQWQCDIKHQRGADQQQELGVPVVSHHDRYAGAGEQGLHARPGRRIPRVEVDRTATGEHRTRSGAVAAAAAARRATADDRGVLRSLAGRLRSAGGRSVSADLMRLDMQVHRAIYTATHNPYLEDTLAHYDNLATRIWCLFLNRLPDLAGHVGEHGGLLDAIVDGEADRAAELAAAHVAHFERAIRAAL